MTRDYQDHNGLVTGTQLGGVNDVYTYNGFGELKTYAVTSGSSTIYEMQIDARDELGRITNASERLGSTTHAWTFAYDVRGELSSVTEDGTTTSYEYDPNGNRSSVNGQPSTYDAQDRLLTSPGAKYSYTNNGDLASEVRAAGTASFLYDLQSSLRSVSLPSGDTVKYVIDGERHRVQRTWTHGAQSVVQGFLYDDSLRVAAELDGGGNVVSTFGYGTKANVPELMVRGAKTYRLVTDWRGSVRAVVDATAGAVVQSIDYDAWGNATVADTTCSAGAVCALFQPFGFAGGLFDRETALVRFGARDYDPSVGRWTQKDPIRFGGRQTNIHEYVGDDPINQVDPTGHIICPDSMPNCAPSDPYNGCDPTTTCCPPPPPPPPPPWENGYCSFDQIAACDRTGNNAYNHCISRGYGDDLCESIGNAAYNLCIHSVCLPSGLPGME